MKIIFTLLSLFIFNMISFGQGSWTNLSSSPGLSRYRAIAFEINGKCYMGTGSPGANKKFKDLWEFDIVSNSWTQKADLVASARINASASSANGYGYVGLGIDSNNRFLKDWWQFDPAGNTWTSKSSFPGKGRFGAGAFSISNRIYVGGGLDTAYSPQEDFYCYDPVNDIWGQKANLLEAVGCMSVFTIGNKGYFVGGVINGAISGVDITAEYSPSHDSWTQKADFPPGQIFSGIGFSMDGYGYVGTGFISTLTDMMMRFDPVANSWSPETSFPTGIRQWAVSCVSGNRAFVGTGNSTGGQLYKDWWEFNSIFTGIIDKNRHSDLNVFFNSAGREITIRNAPPSGMLKIHDINGKLMLQKKYDSALQNLYWPHKGVFMVTISDQGKTSTVKIICS